MVGRRVRAQRYKSTQRWRRRRRARLIDDRKDVYDYAILAAASDGKTALEVCTPLFDRKNNRVNRFNNCEVTSRIENVLLFFVFKSVDKGGLSSIPRVPI